MSEYFHGARASKQPTSIAAPIVAECGIHFIVGTAPVHSVGGKVNEPVVAYSYEEAVAAMGYSEDWKSYDICEEIYTAFVLYGIAPIVMVNVLDPTKHLKGVTTEDFTLTANVINLPFDTVADSLIVKGYGADDVLVEEAYTRGIDYDVFYVDGVLRLERIDGGKITEDTSKLNITYDMVDASKVTKSDIIGGYDVTTERDKGFELIDSVFPKFRLTPGLLLAPNFSSDKEVAAVMAAKAENINGLFGAKAIIDIDTTVATTYQKAIEWKNDNNVTQPTQLVGWPMYKFGEKTYRHSTQLAARITKTDNASDLGGGCPCESSSNKSLQVDSMVLADGTEVLLDLTKANNLNKNGIITGLNIMGGFVSWGNETACYPSNTDVTDYFYSVSRMFEWVANTIILTVWNKVDRRMIPRLIESIVQNLNIWLNGLTAEGKILGGRIEFKSEENTDIELMAGKAKFHIYLTPPSPAKELDFVTEYDSSYLETLFA